MMIAEYRANAEFLFASDLQSAFRNIQQSHIVDEAMNTQSAVGHLQ
jgi:hypothetical protein